MKKNFKMKINDVKVEFGTVYWDRTDFIYSTMFLPVKIDFTKIEKLEYDSLLRNLSFELNRIIYRTIGNTTQNFGSLTGLAFRPTNKKKIDKSHFTIEMTIKNLYDKIEDNYSLLKSIHLQLFDYLDKKEIDAIVVN